MGIFSKGLSIFSALKPQVWPRFVREFSQRSVNIPPDKMCALSDFPQHGSFELMFATKEGLPIRSFPIQHSAVALYNPENGMFAVYGRQSPFGIHSLLERRFNFSTRQDNEKEYLTQGFSFKAYPTNVYFKKSEIEDFLGSADRLINETQTCNMVGSNCYSYSVTAIALALQKLIARPVFDSSAMSRVLTTLQQHPLFDHGSIGVLNNKIVVDNLLSVLFTIKTHLHSVIDKSMEDQQLLKQTVSLMKKIQEESQQYRILSILKSASA